ncbi:MAG: cob(I)yrinic acid a,c-diamide adenosyltransferase [Alicyclobacillaceae bacterium]|nr:cob(I)yrinic acid a,c-diamide adenosyltransferase [Alicyclobacillaceae bacterium]
MRIYTRGGDRGQTSVIGGGRRYKDDVRVEAYGAVDEAGAFIGLAASYLDASRDVDIIKVLEEVQQRLWDAGADLAAPEGADFTWRTPEDAAAQLEPWIDRYQAEADQVEQFILRGGATAAAALHVACSVVRRAERRAVALMRVESVHPPAVRFLNRLSDLLFVLARAVNARANQPDVVYARSGPVFRTGRGRQPAAAGAGDNGDGGAKSADRANGAADADSGGPGKAPGPGPDTGVCGAGA